MKLFIAEKPNVARNICEALNITNRKDGYFEGNGFFVTWAFGHLLQLCDVKDYDPTKKSWKMENFPFVPGEFKYKINMKDNKTDSGCKKQINVINELVQKSEEVIIATDNDREGELIGATITDYLKVDKPIKRILINEWTEKEVQKGLNNLQPISDFKTRQASAYSRQWSDWLIGINLTSVTSLKYVKGRGVLNIGRVILPTLKIVYDRDMEIKNFKPTDYYKLNATFNAKDGKYEGIYKEDDNDKYQDKNYLDELIKNVDKSAIVTNKEVTKKKEYPSSLFNMTALQGYVTTKNKGFTPDQVLSIAQSLYEKKFITYPRTASTALEESLIDKAQEVLEVHKKGLPFENDIEFKVDKRVFNNSKVESHSAIIPTYKIASGLSEDEKTVYEAIKNRFLEQFMPIAEYEETVINTKINNLKGIFYTKGRVEIEKGWKILEENNSKDAILPNVELNENVNIDKLDITSHKTTPPKPHTFATLLKTMETCGKKIDEESTENDKLMSAVLQGYSIGTDATRGETIKKLLAVGYLKQKGKSLESTPLGRKLVEQYPVKNLFNLDYTGKLEKALKDIEKGKISNQKFMSFIVNFVSQSVKSIKDDQEKIFMEGNQNTLLGKCPLCGNEVRKLKGKYGDFYSCSDYKNCNFKLSKICNKLLTEKQLDQLLKDKKTNKIKFKKKDGSSFSAKVVLLDDGSTKLEFK
ncbi:MAG: DNA topoisomerase [bacterium]